MHTDNAATPRESRENAADMRERPGADFSLLYFPDRLDDKLALLHRSRAVVVEAPSGYGKTTAVRHGLKATFLHGATAHWITFVEEAPVAAYERLCRQIGEIDRRAGERLLKIGLPNVFTIGAACDAVRAIECDRDTWLVIDNFHCIGPSLPASFVGALLDRGEGGLHVVVVTQTLTPESRNLVAGRGLLYFDASDLRWETEDIRRYYALAGVPITRAEALKVLRHTAGWVIAIYLQLRMYRETGAFSGLTFLRLMEQLIWEKLTGEQQLFFLRVSPFDAVSERQICGLLACDVVPDYVKQCLSNPFVHYDPVQRRYEFHDKWFSLLAKKRAECGQAFERECLAVAGDLCRREGRIAEALGFYQAIPDYERALSLDFSGLIFAEIGKRNFFDIAGDIARNCPKELAAKHPLSMLRVAWALKSAGKDFEFGVLLDQLEPAPEGNDLLRAEWFLLSAYRHCPDFGQMMPLVEKAAALFGDSCSRVILPGAPWCSGQYFQLSDFHVGVGEADREAEALERFVAVYSRLTNGHGSGADALLRSEIAYFRGDLSEAEIFAYKAAFLAESNGQSIIQLGAAKMLADIALVKADAAAWEEANRSMERAAAANPGVFFIRLVLDTIRGATLSELRVQKRIADWLKNGAFLTQSLPIPVAGNALYVHVMFLLQEGEFARVIGTLEAMPEKVVKKTVFSEFLFLLLMALGHAVMGNEGKAAEFLRLAAGLALPDGFVMSLAMASFSLNGMAEKLLETTYPAYVDVFNQVKSRFGVGWLALRDAIFLGELPSDLTGREREIAFLAAEGLRNNEIARRLFVTENTVRAHMRTIFQKLDIDRRAKLAEKLV